MKKINETFVCISCGALVPLAKKTCRNHCPYCFTSQHVDGNIPGDRVAIIICGGTMYPFEYEIKNGMTKIHFRCVTCDKLHRNKASVDDNLSVLDKYIAIYRSRFLSVL